jgi:hypothetical protein
MSGIALQSQGLNAELSKQLKLDCEQFRAQFHLLHEG